VLLSQLQATQDVLIQCAREPGISQPFNGSTNPLSIDNLQYLMTSQALEDLASFERYYQLQVINAKYNKTVNNKWVVMGGSCMCTAHHHDVMPHLC